MKIGQMVRQREKTEEFEAEKIKCSDFFVLNLSIFNHLGILQIQCRQPVQHNQTYSTLTVLSFYQDLDEGC